MRPHFVLLFVFLLALSPPAATLAQTPTFNIEGVVTDAQQAVLPGVSVTVRNVATGLTRTATTDTDGRYVLTNLPPEGRYELQAELPGFAVQVRNDLVFNAGQRAVINLQMQLSSIQETVTVAGVSPVVQTTSAEVSTTIDRTQFETLPVKERNYLRLITLDSNVVASRPGTNAVTVGGGDVWNFGTYVDGTNNHSKWLTLQRAPQLGSGGFALETVKEMQIITNQFSAEFGGHAAGVSSMITKTGTNSYNGSAFVMIRPGDWDARPPLASTKAPYNQQQYGGVLGGPMIRDKAFFFGSYEYRRERSEVALTSPEATEPVVKTPANEHQFQVRGDVRFTEKSSLAVRYNMVRWNKDNESGGLNLPGTGFLWDNNVDTLHGTFTSIRSERFLNETRGMYSRYTDSRAAKCEGVAIVRTAYSTSGCYDQGTWGVLPEETYEIANTSSLWFGAHTMKVGGSLTYDVTEQLFNPFQNGVYRFAGAPAAFPNPFQFDQQIALVPEARLMFPKAYVLTSFVQDDWRLGNNLTLNLGARYDIEWIKNVPDYPAPADKDNFDPRFGFAWDPTGEQKWAVRGGTGWFTQQHPIFTIVKGGVSGRNGQVLLNLLPGNPLFPTFPNAITSLPSDTVLPIRSIQEISPTLENERAWTAAFGVQRQVTARGSVAVDFNINRGQKHGFLDTNAPASIPKEVLNAANGATVRTVAQADLTRPVLPMPNGFRRVEVLTNEGRFWYQGVRFSGNYRSAALTLTASYTLSKSEDRLNHWFVPEDSNDPELDRGRTGADTPHNFVASATWNVPGSNPFTKDWRLSGVSRAMSGTPYSLRYAGDPTGTQLPQCSPRGCQVARPGARNTERGDSIVYTDFTLARLFQVGQDRLEFRADIFNAFNQWNVTADGYVNVVTAANFRQHTGGNNVWPGRQFQFALTYRF
jgi:hypothetical protein